MTEEKGVPLRGETQVEDQGWSLILGEQVHEDEEEYKGEVLDNWFSTKEEMIFWTFQLKGMI